ncbi:olfactory receptor 2A14-like [Phyllobates terribilis]|uniref:olfactory receptor 2A14-like n=1 Tax=Phyllobates terribilis TaxID=111132 RepID=UPI003CCB4A6F
MRNSTLIIVIMWVCAFINSSFFIIPLLNLTYDRVVTLHQFFCDALTVFNASYGGSNELYIGRKKKNLLYLLIPPHDDLLLYNCCQHLMDNNTYVTFHILPFSSKTNEKLIIFGIFSALYLIDIILNSVVIALICLDFHLHTPMYLFFCNLSVIDICYTTVVIPKFLYILLSGNDLISFTQCFTQVYFLMIVASAEVILFFFIGFDRYVAICHPLSYHQILSKKICTLIMVMIWVSAFLNSLIILYSLLKLPFYEVSRINNFFCGAIDVFHASSGGSRDFYILVCAELVLIGFVPLFCNFLSYVRIIRVILRIKSKEGRRKTFSACLSHLIVMITYYSAGTVEYTTPFSDRTMVLKQILSVFYSTVVPMVNPLIYSLRSSEILRAFRRLLRIK